MRYNYVSKRAEIREVKESNMALQQTLVQGTVQQMILTPKMQQAIEILQLSTLELEKYISNNTENFLLEEIIKLRNRKLKRRL
jgi:DNA-directed RNA polymerase specialized sigma54-like protein